jgi:stage V sporulation protein B
MWEKRKLASNTAYLFIHWVLSTLFSIVFWTLIAKTFLPNTSGIVSASTNLTVTLSGITIIGLTCAIRKLIPEYLIKKQKPKAVGLIHFSLKVTLTISTIVAIALFLLSDTFAPIFNLPPNAIKLVATSLVIMSVYNIFTSTLMGFQSMKKFAIADTINQITKISFTVILVLIGLSYVGAIAAYFSGLFFAMLYGLDYMFLRSPSKKINSKRVMLDYAFPFIVTSVAWLLINNGQYVILTILKGTEATGIFTIAMLISSPVLVLPSILSRSLFPILSQLSVKKNTRLQSYLIKLVFRYTILISFPIAILVVMFSKNLIFLFSRVEYLPASGLFPIIAIASLLYAACEVFYSGLYAIGKPKIQRNIVLAMMFIFLALSLPLTLLFSAKGMSIAYAISMLSLFILSYSYIRKFIRVDLNHKSTLKVFVSSAILIAFIYSVSSLVYGLLSVIVFSMLGALLYILVLFPLKFYTKEDLKILRLVAEKVPMFSGTLNKVADMLSKLI